MRWKAVCSARMEYVELIVSIEFSSTCSLQQLVASLHAATHMVSLVYGTQQRPGQFRH